MLRIGFQTSVQIPTEVCIFNKCVGNFLVMVIRNNGKLVFLSRIFVHSIQGCASTDYVGDGRLDYPVVSDGSLSCKHDAV